MQNKDSLRNIQRLHQRFHSQEKGLEARVDYQSTDSMVMTAGNLAYLYGEGDVKYQQIELYVGFYSDEHGQQSCLCHFRT